MIRADGGEDIRGESGIDQHKVLREEKPIQPRGNLVLSPLEIVPSVQTLAGDDIQEVDILYSFIKGMRG